MEWIIAGLALWALVATIALIHSKADAERDVLDEDSGKDDTVKLNVGTLRQIAEE